VLKILLPHLDDQTGAWKNTDLLYMKVNKENQLEFDMELNVILPVIDNVEFLATKKKGETTYREQPYYYHAQVAKVASSDQVLKGIIKATKDIDFFMLKIKNIFSATYAVSILLSEDGFTLNKVQLSEKADKYQKEKNQVKVAASYFKIEIVKLLFELFFSKSIIETESPQVFEELFLFLVGFEEYRFKVMTFQTRLLSYDLVYNNFIRKSDLFTYYLERLLEATWFKENLQDNDLQENYMEIKEKIETQVREADSMLLQFESVYFYYLKYLINIVTNVVESKKLKDINFKLEHSAAGLRIKSLVRELSHKLCVYKNKASQKTLENIGRFIKMFSADSKEALRDQGDTDLAEELMAWDTLAVDRVQPLVSVKLYEAKTIVKKEAVRKRRPDSKRVTAMIRTMPSDVTSENTDSTLDWNVADNYRIFFELLEENPTTKKKILEEKLSLALSILNFDKQLDKDRMIEKGLASEKLIAKVNLKKDDLIRKMIKYIENQVTDKSAEANLKNLLEVFSLMIRESTEQAEIQDIFNNNKAMEMVLLVLSSNRPLDTSFLKALIVFANSMLENRNSRVQRTVCKHFKTFKQTERTLRRFSAALTQTTATLKDDSRRSGTPGAPDENRQICVEVLKFVVVCCKGHFKEMQNYFRLQPNTSAQFNFVKDTVDLLSALSNRLTASNFEVLILCFDVLIEAVQGPNKENQEFLLKSSILETLAKLLGYCVPVELKSRKSSLKAAVDGQLAPWDIRKMKFKVVVLLQALAELADSPQNVYGRLSKFFSVYLLLVYLAEVHATYTEVYGPEFQYETLNQVGANHQYRNDDELTAAYVPIEGGFYVYFLLKEILKCGCYDKELIGDVRSAH
jgi:hypothetical protein